MTFIFVAAFEKRDAVHLTPVQSRNRSEAGKRQRDGRKGAGKGSSARQNKSNVTLAGIRTCDSVNGALKNVSILITLAI